MQISAGTNSSSSSSAFQACAVCKYQRRKCTPNCPLAPFFPASNHNDFLNTRKLFGVRKVTKFIENLDSQKRVIAMKSIIFQANIRAQDPVHGCCRIIFELQRLIDWHKAELDFVLEQLANCKSAITSQQQQQQQYPMVVNDDQQEVNDINEGLEHLSIYDVMPADEQLCEQEEDSSVFQNNFDGEDIKPLLGIFDEKVAEIPFDCKGSIWSDKLALKKEVGSVQHQLKHDLKDAASLFSLTNGN